MADLQDVLLGGFAHDMLKAMFLSAVWLFAGAWLFTGSTETAMNILVFSLIGNMFIFTKVVLP